MPASSTLPEAFQTSFELAIQRLRGALTELYADVGADAGAPLTVSREIGINRNLSWKIGKIIHSPDAQQAWTHIPAAGSFQLLLSAFERAGASPAACQKLRSAIAEYDAVVATHAGDRGMLEGLVSNLAADAPEGPASENVRRQTFLGNAAVWGVQARLRILTQIITPSVEDPSRLDLAMLGGVFDYKRLRAGAAWPLGQRVLYGAEGVYSDSEVEPIDDVEAGPDELPLIRRFCSTPVPPLRNIREGRFTITELAEGPVGNTGTLSCVFGWILRRFAPTAASADDPYMEFLLRLDTPVEMAVQDVLVHRDIPALGAPRVCLYSAMHGRVVEPICEQERYHLPCPRALESLGSGPPVLATPHLPNYPEIVGSALPKLGRDLSEFRAYRFSMSYPPLPTLADVYFERER